MKYLKGIPSAAAIALAVAASVATLAPHQPAVAQDPIEVTLPDGRVAVLYGDSTWEIKRGPAELAQDTVALDELVVSPNKFKGQTVVVTGGLISLLGAYRLQTSDSANNIVVDVTNARRADQLKLEERFKDSSLTGAVNVQVTGEVETGTLTNRIKASDIVFVE